MKPKELLLSLLHVRTVAAGLEVSDEGLRLAIFDGKLWKMYAVRLAPGILEKGKIKDRAAFIAAAGVLRNQMELKHRRKQINVVVSLGSVDVYTQVLQLPIVQDSGLKEAIELNLRMASPIPIDQAYSGWHVIGHNDTTLQIDVLAAFIDRKTVDELADALFEGGFIAMAVESRGLSLTRLIREKAAGVDVPKSYMFIDIDNFGLDFLVIRNGSLYFEYQNPWRDLMDEKGEISAEKFETTLAASMRQVLNFYTQNWQEPLGAIILSSIAFNEEAEKVITDVASLPAIRLTLVMGQPISSEWLVVLGSSLRGQEAKHEQEINLLGDDSRDRFHEEQFLRFMGFWRTVIPVALGLLVATFIGADVFLNNAATQAAASSNTSVSAAQLTQIATLESQAANFNSSVQLLSSIEGGLKPKNALIFKLSSVADSVGVTITHLSFQSLGTPVTVTGYASEQNKILSFQNDLMNDPSFSNVNLPLTGIQTQGTGIVSFTVSFTFTPPA